MTHNNFSLTRFRGFLVLAILVISQSNTLAQFSSEIGTSGEYNTNPLLYTKPQGSFIQQIYGNLGYEAEPISMGYSLGYTALQEFPDRNYFQHGLSFWRDFEGASLSLNLEQRINTVESEYFDYTNAQVSAAKDFELGGGTLSLGTFVSTDYYPNISILNNYRFSGAFQQLYTFDTRTTIIGGATFTSKFYTTPDQNVDVPTVAPDGSITYVPTNLSNVDNLNNLAAFVRIGQNVFEDYGLSLQFTHRTMFTEVASSVKNITPITGDEAALFDDPATYSGNSLGADVSALLTETTLLKLSYLYDVKNYPTQGVYTSMMGNYNSGAMRSDTQSVLGVSVNHNFSLDSLDMYYLTITLGYRYTDNTSNSVFYNYTNSGFSLGLSAGF